ncbi:MAG: LysE family translocator [Opitutaceae bacterium]
MEFLLKGLVAGFIIAMPLGPVSVLCFRRVLTDSRLAGLATVFGAATADMIYGLIAAVGVTAVAHMIEKHLVALHVFGGLILLGLGLAMLRSDPNPNGRDPGSAQTLAGAYLSSFLLMIANPVIVISFFGVFAVLDLAVHPAGITGEIPLGAGLFAGSASWWLVYKLADALAGHTLRHKGLRAINLSGGLLICAFGLYNLGMAFLSGR